MDSNNSVASPPELFPPLDFLGVKNVYKIYPVTDIWCEISGLI